VQAVGASVFTLGDIRKSGVDAAIDQALEIALDGVDALYVSCDIDVLDGAHAAGTGAIQLEGLEPMELLAVATAINGTGMLAGTDVVEVSPPLDPSGRTPAIAAAFIMAIIEARAFEFEQLPLSPATRPSLRRASVGDR
jgi:arginase family enzyme